MLAIMRRPSDFFSSSESITFSCGSLSPFISPYAPATKQANQLNLGEARFGIRAFRDKRVHSKNEILENTPPMAVLLQGIAVDFGHTRPEPPGMMAAADAAMKRLGCKSVFEYLGNTPSLYISVEAFPPGILPVQAILLLNDGKAALDELRSDSTANRGSIQDNYPAINLPLSAPKSQARAMFWRS